MKKWLISLLFVITLCALRFADPWFMEIMRLKALRGSMVAKAAKRKADAVNKKPVEKKPVAAAAAAKKK